MIFPGGKKSAIFRATFFFSSLLFRPNTHVSTIETFVGWTFRTFRTHIYITRNERRKNTFSIFVPLSFPITRKTLAIKIKRTFACDLIIMEIVVTNDEITQWNVEFILKRRLFCGDILIMWSFDYRFGEIFIFKFQNMRQIEISNRIDGGIVRKSRIGGKFTFSLMILEYLTSNWSTFFKQNWKHSNNLLKFNEKPLNQTLTFFYHFDICSVKCDHWTVFRIRINNLRNIKAFSRSKKKINFIELFSATNVYNNLNWSKIKHITQCFFSYLCYVHVNKCHNRCVWLFYFQVTAPITKWRKRNEITSKTIHVCRDVIKLWRTLKMYWNGTNETDDNLNTWYKKSVKKKCRLDWNTFCWRIKKWTMFFFPTLPFLLSFSLHRQENVKCESFNQKQKKKKLLYFISKSLLYKC